jgi:hypothetical protein
MNKDLKGILLAEIGVLLLTYFFINLNNYPFEEVILAGILINLLFGVLD